jgi:hypothetical protein
MHGRGMKRFSSRLWIWSWRAIKIKKLTTETRRTPAVAKAMAWQAENS